MIAIQMSRVGTTVANEKLRTTRISSGMSHREHAPIMKLHIAVYFTFDGVTWAAIANAIGTTTLDDEIGDDSMEVQTIIKAFSGQINEVLYGVWGSICVKFYLH